MRILALVSIPVLIFLNYFLKLAGKKYRDSVYAKHFVNEEYELNPAWQKDINKSRIFNYKHILLIILITVYIYFLEKLVSDELFYFVYGFLSGVYVYVITKLLQNIMIFRYAGKNPHLLNGEVHISYLMSLKIAQYSILTTALFTLFIFFFTDSVFLLGNTAGLLILWLVHYRWIARIKKKTAAASS